MACGATLKRSMEFEALHSPQSPKRRRCNLLPGSPATPSPQRCHLRPATEMQSPPMVPESMPREQRLTPEQIFQNIRQEYSRYQKRRHEEALTQNESHSPGDERSTSPSLIAAPNSPPGMSMKRDQPSFTMRQVSYLCERLLKDHEEKIREEYEQILNTKLAEQYDSFVKFTQDQIVRRYGTRPASYVS
ncbi:akirin-1 [Chanos chanos]|uniref:Akirin-1 n=1 Tax=Chanos chanos TaxID=29144 RepID=A0A6J2WNS9_CHACN|nr:akirin-1-like [Chanos chanos]